MADRAAPQPVNAFVWGYNNTGELGLGHAARVFRPAPAQLLPGLVDLQGGATFSVALTSSGEVWCWGSNDYGQLGDGTTADHRKPRRVKLPESAKASAIAAGTNHVLALTTSGQVVAWGRNHRGQLGNGTTDDLAAPHLLSMERVKKIAAGDGISAAITAGDRLVTWGRNGSNQLALKGRVPENRDVLRPTKSTLIASRVVAVDAGLRHLVALTWDGQVLTFGLGPTGKPLPRQVAIRPTWGRVRAISAGEDHVVALTNRGQVVVWGANDLGQLGMGDNHHRLTPVPVTLPGARGHVTQIRAGHRHNLVLTDHHEVYTWGEGHFGAVGVGRPKPDATTYPTPQRVPGLDGVQPTGLGGGGYSCAVFVDHGPAAALKLDPPTATVAPGKPVQYRIRAVDAFGNDLGPAPASTTLTVPGGKAAGTTATGPDIGRYTVIARSRFLVGRATFRVQKGTSR